MSIGDASQFVLLLIFSWTFKVQGTCPNVHGGMLISRPSLDSSGWTGLNFGNPITCDGFLTGWRFFPARSEEFVALVFRPFNVGDHKYAVAGRTIIPAQQELNQIREHKLQHSEWIPVLSGDVIGFKFENALLPFTYDDSTSSLFSFVNGVNKHEYMMGTLHVIEHAISYRTYSFQAILHDSYLPCHIIKRPFMKPTTRRINRSKMWMDDWNKIKCPATILGWRFIAGGPGDITALVFRAVNTDDSIYEVVGKTMIPSPAEWDVVTEFKLPYSEQIDVISGDKLGFSSTNDALYQQEDDSDAAIVYKTMSRPDTIEVGNQFHFSSEGRFRRVTFDAILEEPTRVYQSKVILSNFKLQNHVTQSITSKSLATCVTKCLDDEDCLSVNYNEDHMTCDLNDATRDEDSVNVVADAGYTYIETSRKLTNLAGNCAFVDCGLGNICVDVPDAVGKHMCMCSSTGYIAHVCPSDECIEPLGMESGTIFSNQIRTSSEYSLNYRTRYARLNFEGCWASQSANAQAWISIDLLLEHNITGIQTQGCAAVDEWAKAYTISYRKMNGLGDTAITDGYGRPKMFEGNLDRNSIRVHYFNPVIQAVAVKVTIKAWHTHTSMRVEVLGCRIGNEWVRAFKGVSQLTGGSSIYNAWISGTESSNSHAHKFLTSNTHYRNKAICNNWSAFGITKVRLTLFSAFNEELLSIIFNGVGTSTTSWFARENIESSPWEDIKTATYNFFSITGDEDAGRRFFINKHYESCPNDNGWLIVVEGTGCKEWEGYNTSPRILYSRASSSQSWYTGDVGTARAMTIDVKIG